MKLLGIAVAIFAIAAAVVGHFSHHSVVYLLAAFSFITAISTYRSATRTSIFLQILISFFSAEVVLLGGCVCLEVLGLWPQALAGVRIPTSVAITVALFSVLTYAASFIPVARRALVIADRYFRADETIRVPLGLGRSVHIRERHLAAATMMFLVLNNQLQVFFAVEISFVGRDMSNALQAFDGPHFWHSILVEYPIYLTPWVLALYLEFVTSNALAMRWREYLTRYYTDRWLGRHNHYGMMLAGIGTDNPDQRIAEDIPRFINGGQFDGIGVYNFSIQLITALSSLVAYSLILWTLSQKLTFTSSGFHIPGFLFWCALLLALFGTGGTMAIGRNLSVLSFARQHYEANFRFGLARLREYSEQVALLLGELTEKNILADRFVSIVRNFFSIMFIKGSLSAFQNFFSSISGNAPMLIMAPFFFLRKATLGDLALAGDAFGNVSSSLTFFISYYTRLADFQSVLDRLTTFETSLDGAPPIAIAHPAEAATKDFVLSGVSIDLPGGRPLLKPFDLRLTANENVLVTGPSGSGKSTLFRTISGVWPYGAGNVAAPQGAKVMVVPQKPYLPIGTLLAAGSYPASVGTYEVAEIAKVLEEVGLSHLVDSLDIDDNWTQRLSGGEQQRLAIARAILAKPDWLLLDEATSAMDIDLERRTYETIARLLPKTTIVSIAHRPSLADHHERTLRMEPTDDGLFTPRELAKVAAE